MLEQNYTNIEDKGRFGFSESGKFRAPFKSEKALILIFTIIFIAGTLGGLAGGSIFLRSMIVSSPPGTDPTFYAMTGAVIFLGAAALSAHFRQPRIFSPRTSAAICTQSNTAM